MIDLTPDEERFIEKQRQGQKGVDEHDRARAITAAKGRQDKIANGEDPGDDPSLQGLKNLVAEKRLDHSIRLKHLRHHAHWNWRLVLWSVELERQARFNEQRPLLLDYLTDIVPKDALSVAASGSDESKKQAAALLTESLSFAEGFSIEAFRFGDEEGLVDLVYSSEPASGQALEAGRFTLSDLAGFYLQDAASGGRFVATTLVDPVTGAWVQTASGATLAGEGGMSASGAWLREPVDFASLAEEVMALALDWHDREKGVAFWYDQIVNPRSGSAIPLKSLLANLERATNPPSSPY